MWNVRTLCVPSVQWYTLSDNKCILSVLQGTLYACIHVCMYILCFYACVHVSRRVTRCSISPTSSVRSTRLVSNVLGTTLSPYLGVMGRPSTGSSKTSLSDILGCLPVHNRPNYYHKVHYSPSHQTRYSPSNYAGGGPILVHASAYTHYTGYGWMYTLWVRSSKFILIQKT